MSQKTNIPAWAAEIAQKKPQDEREEAEIRQILLLAETFGDRLLSRDCEFAHMTASSIIVNADRTKTLMAFHKIYNSWSWTGGHMDGERDFLAVAEREAQEETGVQGLACIGNGIASVEILPVWAHIKRGKQVSSHLHLNVSYLFEADDSLPLRIAEEENTAVAWIETAELEKAVSEPDMIPIYRRLLGRVNIW